MTGSVDVGDKKQKSWLGYCPGSGIAPHWNWQYRRRNPDSGFAVQDWFAPYIPAKSTIILFLILLILELPQVAYHYSRNIPGKKGNNPRN